MFKLNAAELNLIRQGSPIAAAAAAGQRVPNLNVLLIAMAVIHERDRYAKEWRAGQPEQIVDPLALNQTEIDLIRQGKKYNAMKSLWDRIGRQYGLPDTRKAVELYIKQHSVPGYNSDGRLL